MKGVTTKLSVADPLVQDPCASWQLEGCIIQTHSGSSRCTGPKSWRRAVGVEEGGRLLKAIPFPPILFCAWPKKACE
eukprot:8037408-Pyramimonas_sp.AAC.1